MFQRVEASILIASTVVCIAIGGGVVAGCGTSTDATTTTVTAEVSSSSSAISSTVSSETTVSAPPESTISQIGILAPEIANDYGWNQQGVDGAKTVASDLGATISVKDGAGYSDISPQVRQLVEAGADFLIAHAAGYATVAANLGQELKVPTLVICGGEASLHPDLVQDIEPRPQDGAYLAGVMAAKMTKTKTVGIVISADEGVFNIASAGFATGLRATDSTVKLVFAQVGPAAFSDAASAKRTAEAMIAGGADILFGMGDGASFGYMQACETAAPPSGADKVWFIDWIGDKTLIDSKGVVLSSVLMDFQPVYQEAIEALSNGTFGRELLFLGLDNQGIGLLKTPHIPEDIWAAVEQAREDIIAGTVVVPMVFDKEELDKLIREG